MSTNTTDDGGYTPIWVFSSWAEHWFTGVACAIFANILIFYLTRIYGRRLAIERVLQQKQRRRIRREDSFYSMTEENTQNPPQPSPKSDAGLHLDVGGEANQSPASAPPLVSSVFPQTSVVDPASNGTHVPPSRHQSTPAMPSMSAINAAAAASHQNGVGSMAAFSLTSGALHSLPQTAVSEPVLRTPTPPLGTPRPRSGSYQSTTLQPHGSSALRPALPVIEEEVKTSDLVRVVVLALFIQAFQFTALAIVSLALVTPLTCLFFIWWRVATLETARRKIRKEMSNPTSYSPVLYFASLRRAVTTRFWSIVLILILANSLIIAGGPHEMYVVAVHKVVKLDTSLMIYITIIVIVIVFQGILHSSPTVMESLARCYGLKRTTDLEPLLLGANAGLLGGQYLLLVKLLAEIAEAAILLPEDRPPVEQTYLIILFAFVVGVFHIYAWRRGMGTSRTKLFIPVYRFWFVISGMVASLLCLREFFDSTPADIAIYFIGVFLDLAMLFVMARNALNAVKRDDFSTVIFLEEDPEQGIGLPPARNNNGNKRRRMPSRPLRRNGANKKRSDLTLPPPLPGHTRSLSAPPATRTERAASADSVLSERTPRRRNGRRPTTPRGSLLENSDLFLSAMSPSTGAAGDPSFMRRSFRRESVDSTFARRSFSRERKSSRSGSRHSLDDDGSDGYESVGSFHSEPAESMLHEYHPFSKEEKVVELNYEYTSPDSMIVPKGQWNPWAPVGQSFYFDCATVPGNFKVRGPTYLEDGQKVKCDVSRMKLVIAEWLPNPETPIKNICNHPSHFVQREHVGRKDRPFLFVRKCERRLT